MPKRLRAILVSVPFITVVVLFALYAGFGFLAVPALVKWQVEKRVPEQLGQRVSLGDVRFNPFRLKLQVDDLALSDPQGNALLGFKRLAAEFSLASVIDRTWTFSELALDAPLVHFERDKRGGHNFAPLIKKLGLDEPGSAMPRLVVKRLVLREGRMEFLDRLLDAPLVTRVAPMLVEIQNLSTLPDASAPYRFTARTEAGEKLEVTGALGLNPLSLKGKVSANGVKLLTLARALSREFALEAPAGTIDFSADVDVTVDAQGVPGGGARNVELKLAGISLRAPGAGAPLLAAETLALKDGRIDLAKREIAFGAFHLANGSVAASLDAQGRGDWSGFVTAATPVAGTEAARTAPANASANQKLWRISVASAEVAQIAVRFADATSGRSAAIAALGLKASPSVEVGPQGLRVLLGEPKVSLAGVTVQHGTDMLALKEAGIEAKSLRLSADSAGSAGMAIDAAVEELTLRVASAGLRTQGGSADLAQAGEARAGAQLLTFKRAGGEEAPQVSGEGLSASLRDAILRDAQAIELARVSSGTLSGGALRLRERTFGFDKALIAGGKAKAWLDAKGALNWANLFAAKSAPAGASAASKARAGSGKATVAKAAIPAKATGPAKKAGSAPAGSAWRFSLKEAQLADFSLDFEDRQRKPALALGLDAIGIQVAGYDSGSAKPAQVDLKAKVRSGGQIEAHGKVRFDLPSADMQVKLARIALAPAQSFISDFAALQLAGGIVSAAGHLRYGDKGKDAARLAYKGSIAIDEVKFLEAASKQPFLSWASVSSGDIVATLEPNRVDIGELRVDKPVAKVVIAADRSVNLLDVLNKPHAGAAAGSRPAQAAPAAASPAAPEKGGDPFPVTIARVRVSDGTLDFADLSLRPQFGTQMHEVQGVITGLGTDMTRSAQLQLDARVDKYGSAKIRGRINALDPQKSTDVTMEFRNLEMTALSPYVEKFAGYRIAAGRLSLDLQYKLRDGKLEGQNKVVLHKVELGEKVNSPGALDLPLDLAIAILKDSDGLIDIGLPVSGDLNDPKFDYGAVIAKAFGNLIGGIITAPFRALAALFGGGEKQIDTIDFEPGSDALAPPERQKLVAVARALKERPQLMLKVPPTYAAEADTAALKSYAVRADIVRRMGMDLRPGEDPGPLDASNARVQKAVEASFSERYPPALFAELKSRATQEPPDAIPATNGAAAPAPPAASPQARQVRVFYRGLIDRLVKDAPVAEQALLQLATRRGEAIVRELTSAGGVPAARAALGAPHKADGAAQGKEGGAVSLKLELGVAK